jgi:hypothetical protein
MNNIIRISDVRSVLRRIQFAVPPIRPAVAHNSSRLFMQWSVSPDSKRLTARWHSESPIISNESANDEPGALRRIGSLSCAMSARRLRYG